MTPYRERLNAGDYTNNTAPTNTTTSENGDHTCTNCGRTFTTDHGLKVHQAKTHTDPAPTGYMMDTQ